MEMLRIFPGKIDWVVSVGLLTFSLVNDLSSVSVEDGPLSFGFSESLFKPLSEAVNVRSVDLGPDLHVVF